MDSLEKRVGNMITAGLLDGDPYDDVKEYIGYLENELEKYKSHSKALFDLGDCNTCGVKDCDIRPGWGKFVRINCYKYEKEQK